MKRIILLLLTTISLYAQAASIVVEAEEMSPSGKYAGLISSPFDGVALYANGDQAVKNVDFVDGNGVYTINIIGASSNSSSAGVSLYVDGVKIEAFSFTGMEPTVHTSQKKIHLSSTHAEVKLLLETDNGSNDTFVDKVEFTFDKAIVERQAPVLPEIGAYYSGEYRNMLAEAGFSQDDIDSRLYTLWSMYFCGDADNERVFYEYDEDEAYILDVNNDDVRSEGMSYGMMICVQMDKQQEFNKLWTWVKQRMQLTTGPSKGFIGWKIQKDGTNCSSQCAPDGDEYIAMALMFAAGRWGSGSGIYNYWKEANEILNNSIQKDYLVNSSVVNMFNRDYQQVVFVPYASSAKHTDPSYHMPAFYRLWSLWANYSRKFWYQLAEKSREMYTKFADPATGLMPDYANFDGTACGSGHQEFRYDAWRCAMHMGTDYAWFAESDNEPMLIDRLFSFLKAEGITSYGSEYRLNGTKINTDHSPGLVACNATATLASRDKCSWEILDDCYGASLTQGRYRYYDGMLYFLGYLHASGNFRIYVPAEVLDTALDENYHYTDDGYLLVDDYEDIREDYKYFMRMTESSTAVAEVTANPTDATSHALHIRPGNYDEYYYLPYTLPEDRTLTNDFTSLDFDVYYEPIGDNNNQTLKVCLDEVTSSFYTESTGVKANQGVWKHVSIPLTGNKCGNSFKLYIGVRTRNADFYLDNIRLKLNYAPSTIKNVSSVTSAVNVHNLAGQKVTKTYKGIVIINGKKY